MNYLEIASNKYIKSTALTKPMKKALCLKKLLGEIILKWIIVVDFLQYLLV